MVTETKLSHLPWTLNTKPCGCVWKFEIKHRETQLRKFKCTGIFFPNFMHLPHNNSDWMYKRGTAVAHWLRCYATNRKVAGSIPAGVIGFFTVSPRVPYFPQVGEGCQDQKPRAALPRLSTNDQAIQSRYRKGSCGTRVLVNQRFSNCGPRTTSGPRVLPLWSS